MLKTMTSQNTGFKRCLITSEDLCEEKRVYVCVCVCVNEYEGLSWWKKNLNQLRISLAPSALFVLLITVHRSKQHWAYTAKISRNTVYIWPPLTIYIPDTIFVYLSRISILLTSLKLDEVICPFWSLYFPRSVQLAVIHELPGQMPQLFYYSTK